MVSDSTAAGSFDAKSYVAGIGYQTGALRIAAARLSNSEASAIGGARTTRTGMQYGFGYQMNPALLIGGSYTRSEGSSLTNLQARYSLSKRTTGYLMTGIADNAVAGTTNFLPYAVHTGTLPAPIIGGYGQSAAASNARSQAVGAGLIHTF